MIIKLKKIIKEAVQEALDPVGKTEKGKKVGVGQIRDIDNDGDIDDSDSYLALRRKKITQAIKKDKKEDLNETSYSKTTTWGEIPSIEEIEELLGDEEEFEMNLQGADSMAWEYAMELADNPLAGISGEPESLHASLEALVNIKSPDELTDDEYEEVEKVLDRWNERYPDEAIEEQAWSIASGIVDILGIEWI